MKINWSQIVEGWRNSIIPPKHLKELIEETSKERLQICETCPWHSSNREGYTSMRPDEHCTDCGCTLSAKTKCLSCDCPLEVPKWKAVITEEEEEELGYEDSEDTPE